jgi:hypothetical protein
MIALLLVCRWPLVAPAHVESKPGEKRNSPKDRCPDSNRSAKEPSYDDSEKEGCVGAEQKAGASRESEHEGQVKGGGAAEAGRTSPLPPKRNVY